MEFKKFIAVSDFAMSRHTDSGEYTHYKGSWNDLENRTTEQFQKGCFTPGYKDGVVLVQMEESEAQLFRTYNDFPMFEGMRLKAEYKPRREGEEPRIVIHIKESKQQCNYVDIVLYRWDVLAENNERSTSERAKDAEWEIVSINGRRNKDPEPMQPLTMARNFLHLTGGTKGEWTAEDFAKSIVYWSKKINNG